jgi:hypothetical protein
MADLGLSGRGMWIRQVTGLVLASCTAKGAVSLRARELMKSRHSIGPNAGSFEVKR